MARRPTYTYLYRAFFKPKSLDVFEDLSESLDHEGRGLGYTQAWHRSNWSGSPYAVYNEFICGEIGRFLRLPIPPFAMTFRDAGSAEPLFSSLDFNFSRATLPHIIPDLCVKYLPKLCAGVLAFDILIANEDRHDENLLVDNVVKPRRMHVYDHDQALLGGSLHQGVDRLTILLNRLGITGSTVTGGNQHVFLYQAIKHRHFQRWIDRIKEIPDWFIEAICSEARHYGLEQTLADKAAFFLHHRVRTIQHIVDTNRSQLPLVDWPPPPAKQTEMFP